MKVKPVKLREAHKNTNNGKPSICSVLWDNKSTHIATSSSSDSSIFIYESLLLSTPLKNLRYHQDGVTALALSPNSTCLASGSIDRTVKLYKFPRLSYSPLFFTILDSYVSRDFVSGSALFFPSGCKMIFGFDVWVIILY